MKGKISILDSVALTRDFPEHNLASGQVGTIVELLDTNHFEVEFCANNGKTYALATLPADALIVLHYDPVAA